MAARSEMMNVDTSQDEHAVAERKRLEQLETNAQGLNTTQLVELFAKAVAQFGKELQCAICLSLMNNPSKLPCSHAFCKECLTESLRRKSQCPLCKTTTNRREVSQDHKLAVILQQFRKIGVAGNDSSATADSSSEAASQSMSQVASISQLTRKFDDGEFEIATFETASSNQPAKPAMSKPTETGFNFITTSAAVGVDDEEDDLSRTQQVSQERTPQSDRPSRLPLRNRLPMGDTPQRSALLRSSFQTPGSTAGNSKLATPGTRSDLDTPATVVVSPTVRDAWNKILEAEEQRKQVPQVPEYLSRINPPSDPTLTACRSAPPAKENLTANPEGRAKNPQVQTKSPHVTQEDVGKATKQATSTTDGGAVQGELETPKRNKITDETPTQVNEVKQVASPPQCPDLDIIEVIPAFRKGEAVTVKRRMQPGSNKPGGVARISKVNPNGTYNVKYILGGRESNLSSDLLTKGIDMDADSMVVTTKSPVKAAPQSPVISKQRKDLKRKSPDTTQEKRSSRRTLKPTSGSSKTQDKPGPSLETNCSCSKLLKSKQKSRVGDKVLLHIGPEKEKYGVIEKWDSRSRKYVVKMDENGSREKVGLGNNVIHFLDRCPDLKLSNAKAQQHSIVVDDKPKESNAPNNGKRKRKNKDLSSIQNPKILVSRIDPVMVDNATKSLGGDTVSDILDGATHLVIKSSIRNGDKSTRFAGNRTVKYLQALAFGVWIVDQEWVKASVKHGAWLDEESFELSGDLASAKLEGISLDHPPKRARLSKQRRDPPLLKGTAVYLCGEFGSSSPPDYALQLLIINAGGTVLQPDELSTLRNSTGTDRFVAVCENLTAAKRDMDFKLIKKLDLEESLDLVGLSWLMNSIGTFERQSTLPYRLIKRRSIKS